MDWLLHRSWNLTASISLPRLFSNDRWRHWCTRVRRAPPLKFTHKSNEQFIYSIITVNTYSAILSPVDYPRDKLRSINPFNSSSSSGSGSWLGFFFKLFLFAGVCVGAFYGYQIYLERNGRATYGGAFGGPGGRYGGGLNHYVERFTGNSKRFWGAIMCTWYHPSTIEECVCI